MAAYLPIAFIRDCVQKFLRRYYQTDGNDVDESSMTRDSPTNNCQNGNLDIEQQQPLADEKSIKDLHSQKEGKLGAFDNKDDVDILIHQRKLSTKEIATLSLFIGPIWFLSEVRGPFFFVWVKLHIWVLIFDFVLKNVIYIYIYILNENGKITN